MRQRLTYANVVSSIALFLVLAGGAAYAANTVLSTDIVDGQVKNPDLGGGAVTSEKVADDSLLGRDVFDNTLKGADIDESTLSSIGGGGSAGGDLIGSYPNPTIRYGAVSTGDVADGSLYGVDIGPDTLGTADIYERSLTPLDGHDSFAGECDPHDSVFIVCDELTFSLGRPMEISATFVYGFGTDGGGDNPRATCQTTLDGAAKDADISLNAEDDQDYALGGTPIVDVMNLPAGEHTVGLECRENGPNHGTLMSDVGISVVELGFD